MTHPGRSDDWFAVRRFPGAVEVLAAQAADLPQPDQLCGPFAAAAALHAVLDDSRPGLVEIALAAGTRIWPYDVPAWRPLGAPLRQTGWDLLPGAADPEKSGTDASGLAPGIERATGGRVAVVPATGPGWSSAALRSLLVGVRDAAYPVGVVANLRTGPMSDPAVPWDVGHFVVLWGLDEEGQRVAVADSYAQLGPPGAPVGCRLVDLETLVRGLTAPPGRGLLLLAHDSERGSARDLVVAAGLRVAMWEA